MQSVGRFLMTSKQRRWQMKMTALGKCPHCGKDGGECDSFKEQKKKLFSERRVKGLCVWCGTPCAPYKYCEEHRKHEAERMRQTRLANKGD